MRTQVLLLTSHKFLASLEVKLYTDVDHHVDSDLVCVCVCVTVCV